jgi:tyrosyl-tRNA synthetase
VTKADGTKFGKTESGTVWLDAAMTSPYRLYQFLLQSEDKVVGQYLRFFTFLPHDEIAALDAETAAHPERRAAPRALARAVVELVHGAGEAERAERASAALFGEELAALDERTLLDVFDDAPSSDASRQALVDGLSLVEAMVDAGLAASRGEARRTIAQGGAYVNNLREGDEGRVLGTGDLLHDRYVVLRRGRRDFHLLRIG